MKLPLIQWLFIILITAFVPAAAAGQQEEAGNGGPVFLYPVELEGEWGYIDEAGTIVISPQFTEASPFSGGVARVKKGDSYRYIDSSGETVLNPDQSYPGDFSEGLAPFYDPGQESWGYINKEGEVVISPRFSTAYPFSEGFAVVDTNFGNSSRPSWGYIDTSGDFLVRPRFYGARAFSEGLAPVLTGGFVDGKWGYIDRQGKMRIAPRFDEAFSFSDGLAAVDTAGGFDNTYGYIGTDGSFVIEAEYDFARRFSKGRAPVSLDDLERWVYIDREGNRVSDKYYEFADPFRGPLARVAREASGHGYGHMGGELSFFAESESWIYINRSGEKVWPGAKKRKEHDRPAVSRIGFEDLIRLLPASIGEYTLREAGEEEQMGPVKDVPPNVSAEYVKRNAERDDTLRVLLGYGPTMQLMLRGELMEEDPDNVSTVSREGQQVSFFAYPDRSSRSGKSYRLQAAVFPGNFALFVGTVFTTSPEEPSAGEKARGLLFKAIDAIGPGRLTAFTRKYSVSAETPEGFRDYTADISNLRFTLSYPEDWQLVDVHRLTGFIPGVMIVRDPSSSFGILGTLSRTDLKSRENALVSVATVPGELSPVDFLRQAQTEQTLAEFTVLQPPRTVEVSGRDRAAEMVVKGKDAGGRVVISRQLAFAAAGRLFSVTVVTPDPAPAGVADKIEDVLDSIRWITRK